MKRLALVLGAVLSGAAPRVAHANFDWAGHVELDAEGLQSDDPAKRAEAVSDLSKYDIALTQPYLMRALSDDDDKVRLAAAKALGLGRATAAVPQMVDWLGDADPKTRQDAADVLGDIGGPEATNALTRSLGDGDAAVRQHAVKALGEIGKRGSATVVIALIPRLEDEKSDVRIATITVLEELGDRRAVIPLVARFNDTSTEAKRLAVRAVGKLGDASAVPALVRMTSDNNDDVRTAAVASLGLLGAVEAIDALTEQLGTGTDAYRTKVAYALGQIAATPRAGKAGEDAMLRLVENLELTTTRSAAREALAVAGKAAVPGLVAHLQGRIKGDPATAVELLARAGDRRATATLAAELERGRVPVPLVLRALGATNDPAALVPVLGALSSKDAQIRLAAMEALRPLIGTDARAGDVLVAHLTDDNLEVRVLAAEYLGVLRVGAATKQLVALVGPGQPARLRRAAIDALGAIGRAEASPALVQVLRAGPAELHRSAATALGAIADPASIAPLVQLARTDRGTTRAEVVRAIGRTLASHPNPDGRKLLRDLANDGGVKVSIAAIGALAAARDASDGPFLRGIVATGAADRQRAAAWALGELHDTGGLDALGLALSSRDDRLAGDAAWAVGEILAAAPSDSRAGAMLDRALHAAHVGGWAAAIDGAAAVARVLWAVPKESRASLATPARRDALIARTFHKSRLVRVNVAHALAAIGDDASTTALGALLRDDASPHVRAAAARALKQIGSPAALALVGTASSDTDPGVREAVAAAPVPPPARTEWRMFYVVDPSADDAPVRQEPYFVPASDGVVWATYTDARGEFATEHIPAGDAVALPASRESEF